MSIFKKQLPEYYDWMYVDGYTPEECLEAARRTLKEEIEVRKDQKKLEEIASKELESFIEEQLQKLISQLNFNDNK